MAISSVSICNIALTRIGSSRQIASLDENSAEARLCKLVYEPMRDAALEDWPWPFATARVALALVATDPNVDWSFSYRYPPDCLRVQGFVVGNRTATPPPFDLGVDAAGRLLFCDIQDAVIAYTSKVTNVAVFSTAFELALAWRIAAEIAMGLTKTQSIAANALAMYHADVSRAQANGANEVRSDPPTDSEFIAARA